MGSVSKSKSKSPNKKLIKKTKLVKKSIKKAAKVSKSKDKKSVLQTHLAFRPAKPEKKVEEPSLVVLGSSAQIHPQPDVDMNDEERQGRSKKRDRSPRKSKFESPTKTKVSPSPAKQTKSPAKKSKSPAKQ